MAKKPIRKRPGRPPAPVRDPLTGAIDLDATAAKARERKEAIQDHNRKTAERAAARKNQHDQEPLPPRVYDDRYEMAAYNQARVEQLMRKGFTDGRTISELLSLTEVNVHRHMKQIYVRWEALGADKNFAKARGELISRYNMIIEEGFARLSQEDGSSTSDPRNATALLSVIKQTTDSLAGVMGVTPKAVERSLSFTGDKGEIISRMQRQERMAEIAAQLNQIIKKNRGIPGDDAKEVREVVVLDGEPN